MKENELRLARGKIAEKFIGIEQIIAAIVCYYYLGKEDVNFMLNILGNDQATFGFKRNMLQKLIAIDDVFLQNLNKLNKIRNIFLHSPRMGDSNDSGNFYFRNPESTNPVNKELDPEKLLEDFMTIFPETYLRLHKEAVKLGMPI